MGSMRRLQLSSLTFFALAALAYASSGDRAPKFQTCVTHCLTRRCNPPPPVSTLNRLTHWTCGDECQYLCMHYITDLSNQAGVGIEQYYGKWPFWRMLGMQEPASVLFSIFNLLFHWEGADRVRSAVPDGHPMKKYYLCFASVSMNAWVWSSVFHTRDLPLTEKLDYFSAALAIMYAFYYTVVRLFHLYTPTNPRAADASKRQIIRRSLAFACTIAFLAHVSYLTLLPRFDYSYNMSANLVVGMAHNVLWLLFSLPAWFSVLHRFPARARQYRPAYAWKAALFVALTTGATALELFDFPPLGGYVDAHALWHLATAPIVAFWYDFLVQDACDEGWNTKISR